MMLNIRHTGSKDYGRYLKVLICGDPGAGKGNPLDTPVLTPKGWREIGDLVVGDEVIGSDGWPTQVTDIFDRGVQEVFRVIFSDGESVLCDGDHLWEVQTRKTFYEKSQTKKILSTKELLADDKLVVGRDGRKPIYKYCIPLVAPVQFEQRELSVDPYLLGVLLANGSLKETSTIFTTNNEDVVRRIRERCPELEVSERTPSGARRWAIGNFNERLRGLGIKDLGSHDKFIPQQYLLSSVDDRRALLAGLMDCDGSARGTRRPQYYTTSRALRDGVIDLVQSLGGTASWKVDSRRNVADYIVDIRLPFSPFFTPSKLSNDHWQSTFLTRWIVSIEPEGADETRCIKVAADDELFVIQHYVVTHNTLISSTFDRPFYASAEGGLMSIADRNVPYMDIRSSDDLLQLKAALTQDDSVRAQIFGGEVNTIVIDTIDEIQRILIRERLEAEKKDKLSLPDFGWLGEQMQGIIRGFRNLEMNVVFTAHLKETRDEELGRIVYKPALQGAIADQIPGYVDLALLLTSTATTEVVGKEAKRVIRRHLQTFSDQQHPWIKDRSGKMPQEFPVNFKDDYARIHEFVFQGVDMDEVEESQPEFTDVTAEVDQVIAEAATDPSEDLVKAARRRVSK